MEQPTPDDLAKALALLAQALCSATDARVVLQSLMTNAEAIQQAGGTTPGLYALVQPMLLAVSSVVVKQNPGDQDMLEVYRSLRAPHRH